MKRMKLLLFFLGGLACAADLAGVHRVYVMPMPRGMDQYLANRLAAQHVFEIVTDPKLADSVFTDRLGQGFESQLEEIAPKKNPEPVAKPEPAPKPADSSPLSVFNETANKVSNPALLSSFSRGRGTVFLVDAKSRSVVWSVYNPPKGTTSKDLDHTASDIVGKLKKDLGGVKK
jgi:hypothetical protein